MMAPLEEQHVAIDSLGQIHICAIAPPLSSILAVWKSFQMGMNLHLIYC